MTYTISRRTEQAIYQNLQRLYETENYELINRWANYLYDADAQRILSRWTVETLYQIQNEL
jgi:hypothetical protein